MKTSHIKTTALTAVVAGAVALAAPGVAGADRYEHASGNDVGLGLMLGVTSGLSGKIYTDSAFAFAFGVGSSHDGFDASHHGFSGQLDVLWHPARLYTGADLELPVYVGVGGRLVGHDHAHGDIMDQHTALGVRAPVGLALEFTQAPVDVFFELALGLDVVGEEHAGAMYLGGTLGSRYFF